MMRYWVLLLFSFTLLGCTREPLYHSQTYVFGTLVDISIYGETDDHAQQLTSIVSQKFQSLHNRMHAWHPSELTQINQSFKRGDTLNISPDMAKALSNARDLSVQSNGLFNPAIGGLIHEWGFQKDEFFPIRVNNEKITALVKANPQMTDVIIENNKIYSTNRAVQIDLGGYAKGYALDIAARYLREQGVKNALINIGGNIIALGKHGKNPWRVGIQHPRQPNALASIDLPDGWAIGTSGDYQRYFELDGKRYCHIIDPRTGYPAQGIEAVTVLISPQTNNTGVLSDVASKPIFIAKGSESVIAAKNMQIQDYLIIDSNGQAKISASLAKKITWLDESMAKHAVILP